MGINASFDFSESSNYTFDTSKIDVSGGSAQLKLVDNTSQTFTQNFASSSGFTYDPAYTEFAAGVCRQKSLVPADAMSYATFQSSINLTYGGGSLTGTAVGGAAVSGGRLQLRGGTIIYASYSATSNANFTTTGAIKFLVVPQYSGSPVANRAFFSIENSAGSVANAIQLYHTSAGGLTWEMWASSGSPIFSASLGAWSPSSGTTYEFEININVATGASRLFIDGVQKGSTQTATGTRTNASAILDIGTNYNRSMSTDMDIDDFIVFNTVQHTSNYTPGYILSNTQYREDLITFPAFTYSGLGDIQDFTNFAVTEVGAGIRYNINGLYYSSGWVSSDDTWTQMNDKATILANIATLPAADSIIFKAWLIGNSYQNSMDDLILTYTGQLYTTTNPKIKSITTINAQELESFDATISVSGSDAIKFTIEVNDVEKYWDGAAWSNSSGYAQSNTFTDINTNASSLDLDMGYRIRPICYIHSNDGSTSPNIDEFNFDYNFWGGAITPPNECVVWGYIYDSNANPLQGISIKANLELPSYYNNQIQLSQNRTEVFTDVNGYWDITLIETTNMDPNIKYKFEFKGLDYEVTEYKSVPDAAYIAYSLLT